MQVTRDDYQFYVDFSELISKVSEFYFKIRLKAELMLNSLVPCYHKSIPSANFAKTFAKKPSRFCDNQCTNLLPTTNITGNNKNLPKTDG